MRAVIAILIGLVAGVLGYGYWHTSTHATIHVTLSDAAAPKETYGRVSSVQLAFLDAAGKVLATGKTDEKYGVVWVTHPVAGYCGPDLAPAAYRVCFDAHAVWLLTWVPHVRLVSVAVGNCRLERVPLRFSAYRDSMWTWWIPLRHIGGTPYTNYSAYLEVNSKTCAVTGTRG